MRHDFPLFTCDFIAITANQSEDTSSVKRFRVAGSVIGIDKKFARVRKRRAGRLRRATGRQRDIESRTSF
jgi:hypothetical protein